MSTTLEQVRAHYRHATELDVWMKNLVASIRQRLELMPNQVMLATSICADDINQIQFPRYFSDKNSPEDTTDADRLLGPFNMGGLDGFPFTGRTGMMAYAAHVPTAGLALLFYGPHIGVSGEGRLGEINRTGIQDHSSCCGAAKIAIQKLKKGQIVPGDVSSLDHQQNTLEQILLHNKTEVLAPTEEAQRLKVATEVLYQSTDARLQMLVGITHFPCRFVLLVGGVLINGDANSEAFFECRTALPLIVVDGEATEPTPEAIRNFARLHPTDPDLPARAQELVQIANGLKP